MRTPEEYAALFNSSITTFDPEKLEEVDCICSRALGNVSTYKKVSDVVKIPWAAIAAIHFRESNQDFRKHLHNGDPLSERTVHVPIGRPIKGEPPFFWFESAIDALSDRPKPSSWDIGNMLSFIERYNGLGYLNHGINTPYLWNYTDKYISGLFKADGILDPDAKESRPGAVIILKTLAIHGVEIETTT